MSTATTRTPLLFHHFDSSPPPRCRDVASRVVESICPIFTSERVRTTSDETALRTNETTSVGSKSPCWTFTFPPPLCSNLRRGVSNQSEESRPERRPTVRTSNVTRSTESRPSRWTWRVTNAMLEAVPCYYPLEPTSLFLPDVPVHVISARISNFLRIKSIASSYRLGTTQIKCTTSKLAIFSINLWKRSCPLKDFCVILELRRLQGCAIEIQRVRHGLYHAVTTGQEPIPTDAGEDDRQCSHRLLQEMYDNYHSSPRIVDQNEDSETVCLKMLQSNCRDQNRLGMESFRIISDPASTQRREESLAKSFCQNLLFSKDDTGQELREALVDYFVNVERPSDVVDNDDEFQACYDSDGEDEQAYTRGSHFGSMHNIALRVLANALDTATQHLETPSTSMPLDLISEFWLTIVEALLYNLTVASHRANEAALSAKCMLLVMELEPNPSNNQVAEDRLLTALIQANEYGKSHHLALETETQNLMTHLAEVE